MKPQKDVPSWNSRCTHENGSPFPWSPKELIHALGDAVDAVPACGVYMYELQARLTRLKGLFTDFLALTASAKSTGHYVLACDFYSLFIDFSGVDDQEVSQKLFGDWVSESIAMGGLDVQRQTKTKSRLTAYVGIDPVLLARNVAEACPGMAQDEEKDRLLH